MKKVVRAEVNSFVKGLITEASPLNYPENASLAETNFELNRDGSRDRRLGLDYEPNFSRVATSLLPVESSNFKINSFKWAGVEGNGEDDFLVVQLEQTLKFFDLSVDSVSGDGYLGEVVLTLFPTDVRYSFANVDGSLIVVGGVDKIATVIYDGSSFSVEYDYIRVRDVWGVQPIVVPEYETDPSFRGGFDAFHSYNLQNQSWGIPRKESSGTLVDPVPTYFIDLGFYPSNSEVVWTGLQFQPVTAGVTFERMYTNLYTELKGVNVKAPKGYFLIDLLNRGVSRKEAFESNYTKYPQLSISTINLPVDSTPGGATVITEFAGRTWFAGFNGQVVDGDSRSPNLSNFILFSQQVKNKKDIVKCYQEGDPSSREESDVVETDGGFLRLSGAVNIKAMINLDTSLIVIADNGVWTITGGGEYGFTATNYKVGKISTFGGLSNSSVVVENGRVFYWAKDGIYVISKNQFGDFTVQSITESTIQTYYEEISNEAKEACVGTYDPNSKKIRWLYNTGERFTSTSKPRELILDVSLNAFYPSDIGTLTPNTVEVFSLFPSLPFKRGVEDSTVYSESDEVLSDTDDVVISESIRTTGLQSIRYLTVEILNDIVYIVFSYYRNSSFMDWASVNGVGIDAKGTILTGHATAGDSAIDKQIPYLVMHFYRTENGVDENLVPINQSSCFFRCQWSFSNTINSKKWSALKQAYRYRRPMYVTDVDDEYDNGFEIITTKNLVRGNGPAFALYFETEAGKDCRIVGWNLSLTGNANG
jgi:hypothetical protein